MQKIISLLLCLLLVLSLATSAFAEDTTPSATVTLTVNGEKSGHTYVAYQIFSGTVTAADIITNVEWGTGIKDGEALLTALQADNTEIVNTQSPENKSSMKKEFSEVRDAMNAALKMLNLTRKTAQISQKIESELRHCKAKGMLLHILELSGAL